MHVHVTMAQYVKIINKCTYQWHPHSPTPGVGWGNSVDLTEYHVKNPSPGALLDVSTPIYHQESIGD